MIPSRFAWYHQGLIEVSFGITKVSFGIKIRPEMIPEGVATLAANVRLVSILQSSF